MKKKQVKNKKKAIFPLFLLIGVISVGLGLAVSQTNLRQNVTTRAQAVPTPDQSKFDPKAPPTNCPNTAAELQNSTNETALINAINEYRQRNNLRPLQYSAQLKKAAKWYSKDLSQRNVQMPNGIDSFNRPLENRLFDCVVDVSGEFTEQIAIGANVDQVSISLGADPNVNGNLLSPTADMMAAGVTGNYWVVIIVAPPGSPPNRPIVNMELQQQEQQQQQQPSQAPAAGGGADPNIPSPACLGSCPTTVPDTGGAAGGQDPQPTPCPSNQFNANNAAADIEANHRKKKKNKGNDDALLKKLIELLEQLISMLGGGTVPSTPSTGTGGTPDGGSNGTGGTGNNPC